MRFLLKCLVNPAVPELLVVINVYLESLLAGVTRVVINVYLESLLSDVASIQFELRIKTLHHIGSENIVYSV